MFHDRMRKEVMNTAKDASLKVEGEQRHSDGKEMPESSITVFISAEEWRPSAGKPCVCMFLSRKIQHM